MIPDVWQLPTRCIGRRVLVFEELDSTNTFAAQLADDPSNDGAAVLADVQTAGRGQHGRVWQAAPKTSVLLSVVLHPPPNLRRAPVVTAWAALAVCRTVQQLAGISPNLKWPNDVHINDHKVCGILIEQGRGVVAGIGLNVRQNRADFEALGLPLATSLAQHMVEPPTTHAVARVLLRQLDAEWGRLLDGQVGEVENTWKPLFSLLGRPVRVVSGDEIIEGRLTQLGFDVLTIEVGGRRRQLRPECVRHLTAYSQPSDRGQL
jgi:BirA family transcriptional regulator, biotin operon repressor / biotin---[acetyl-CoA-carboxylase] ligase